MFLAKSSILSSRTSLRLISLFLGTLLVIGGLLLGSQFLIGTSQVEVLQTPGPGVSITQETATLTVDISGAVTRPGVYKLPVGSRVEDALVASGGLSEEADRNWVEKNLNRAAKLVDGQKLFIPPFKQSDVLSASNSTTTTNVAQSYTSSDSNLTNINTATLEELIDLPGIGQVYGQSIIDHRPYSDIGELTSEKIIPQSTLNKIKDKITVY